MRVLKKIILSLGNFTLITILLNKWKYKILFFKLKSDIQNLENDYQVIFFYPYYHMGGAELVHLNIVKSVKGYKCLMFFTMPSGDNQFIEEFNSLGKVIDVEKYIRTHEDFKTIKNLIIKKIESIKPMVIFGCHSPMFYVIISELKNKFRTIDLIHAFTDNNEFGYENQSLPFLKFLSKRIVITNHVKSLLKSLYEENGIDKKEAEKIQVIYNATHLTNCSEIKKDKEKITLVYAGRNSPEKRIHLIGQIASRLKQMNFNFEMVLIGSNLKEGINSGDRSSCTFLGALSQDEIAEWYQKAHAVLITSKREGFPMVFMEGMVFGCIPISTNVGGISELLKNEETGILIENSLDEDELIERFIREIIVLFESKEKYQKISSVCSEFAQQYFTMDRFIMEYRNLLLSDSEAA